jgi:formylglycine-generating enzyme required for sulfatase activity
MNKTIFLITPLILLAVGCSSSSTQITPTAIPSIEQPQPTPTLTILPTTETPLPAPELPPDPGDNKVWKRTADGMVMLYIPAGEFTMGSEPEDPCAHPDEQPKHEVFLDPYWIGQTEVTNAQYQACVEAGICQEPTSCGSGEFSYQDPTKDQFPVSCLTWEEAGAYCAWIGGRLPSEAQWEKAARGSDYLKFPWGNEFDQTRCNSQESDLDGPLAVGSYSPEGDSPFGLQDMAGNVWEWTRDWYDIEYYGKAPRDNPGGPVGGERRSLRGGSWYANYCSVRTSYRYYDVPHGRSTGVGFRCVILPSP